MVKMATVTYIDLLVGGGAIATSASRRANILLDAG